MTTTNRRYHAVKVTDLVAAEMDGGYRPDHPDNNYGQRNQVVLRDQRKFKQDQHAQYQRSDQKRNAFL